MFDCDICRYLPDYTDIEEDTAVSRTVGLLSRIHVQSEDLGRHAHCTHTVKQCPNCATLYLKFYAYDAADSHVEPPTSRTEAWRLNLAHASSLLRSLEQAAASDDLQTRHPALIDDIRRRMQPTMPANFFSHMVDSLVDQAIADNDWAGLRQELLDHPSPAVGLRALKGMLRLLCTSPSDQQLPRSRGSRPITRATRAQSVPFIQQHLAELCAELDRRQPLDDWRMQRMYTSILREPSRYGLE